LQSKTTIGLDNAFRPKDSSRCLVARGARELESIGIENARLDAEIMLAAASNSSRGAVISGLAQVDEVIRERYLAMIAQRRHRAPLAYILGHKEFYSLELEVTPAVLIPRPETETVVSTALEFIQSCPKASVWDVGTGSGAIALAIAANAPGARVTATDISASALAVARRNTTRLELDGRVRFRLADCCDPADRIEPLGRFDLIVSNPPYIRDEEIASLDAEISCYEPRIALSGGHDGLGLYRRLARVLPDHLEKSGSAVVEIGAGQLTAVCEIMRNAGAVSIKVVRDHAGTPRVVIADFR